MGKFLHHLKEVQDQYLFDFETIL